MAVVSDPYVAVILVVLLALVIGVFVWFVILGFQVRRQEFSGTLSGSQVVPPTDSPGSGVLSGTLETQGSFLFNIVATFPSTDTVTQVGIYQGPTGSTGPLLLTISGPTSPPYQWSGTWDLSPTDVQNLSNGNLYLSISTRNYPSGAIRTQILRS